MSDTERSDSGSPMLDYSNSPGMGDEQNDSPTGRNSSNVSAKRARPVDPTGLDYSNSPSMPQGDETDGQKPPGAHYSIHLPGMEMDKDFTSGFRKTAADLGLSQDTVSALAAWYAGESNRVSRMTAAEEKNMKALEAQESRELMLDWGPQHNTNRASAIRAMEEILTGPEMKLFRSAGFIEDPFFLRLFHRLRGHTGTNRKGAQRLQRSPSGSPMLDYSASNMPEGDD